MDVQAVKYFRFLSSVIPSEILSTQSIFRPHGVRNSEGLLLPSIQVPRGWYDQIGQPLILSFPLTNQGRNRDHSRTTQKLPRRQTWRAWPRCKAPDPTWEGEFETMLHLSRTRLFCFWSYWGIFAHNYNLLAKNKNYLLHWALNYAKKLFVTRKTIA